MATTMRSPDPYKKLKFWFRSKRRKLIPWLAGGGAVAAFLALFVMIQGH